LVSKRPTTISNKQIKKSFKPTSTHKKLWDKFIPKSSESPYQIRANRPTYTK